MAPPSQLSIATSSVQRLVKEEGSYHKELTQQETRLEKLLASKDGDENAEYQVKQEACLVLPCSLQICGADSLMHFAAEAPAAEVALVLEREYLLSNTPLLTPHWVWRKRET
jgi:hypothetical protein